MLVSLLLTSGMVVASCPISTSPNFLFHGVVRSLRDLEDLYKKLRQVHNLDDDNIYNGKDDYDDINNINNKHSTHDKAHDDIHKDNSNEDNDRNNNKNNVNENRDSIDNDMAIDVTREEDIPRNGSASGTLAAEREAQPTPSCLTTHEYAVQMRARRAAVPASHEAAPVFECDARAPRDRRAELGVSPTYEYSSQSRSSRTT